MRDRRGCQHACNPCRPRRRSRYSAAADEGEGYSDAEDYEDDMGSGSLGRDEAGRKKVGRPIAYKGDPNSPHLTEDERRRIKRYVALNGMSSSAAESWCTRIMVVACI